jgi:putative inorganic carbon (HCO3(-)) transporter
LDVRSIVVFTIFCFFMAKTIKAPYIGVAIMAWIGYMNPHRLVPWGFIYSLPLAAIAFAITLIAYMMDKNKPKIVWHTASILMLVFLLWCAITTSTSINPSASEELMRFFKILLIVALALMIVRSKKHIVILVSVIAASIGFYSTKGGVFAILTGGSFRVWGPPDSFIEGNNELALATLMILPLVFFLISQVNHKWIKIGLAAIIFLSTISVIASYSRGAFLAMIVTAGFLWIKSKIKIPLALAGFVLIIAIIPVIPQQWYDRMDTIETYEEDKSAMGRINSWTMAFNLAKDRPLGGGFRTFGPTAFALYAPEPNVIHDAHSIYFEILAEQGFVGLFLFLGILGSSWLLANRNIRMAKGNAALEWVGNLSRMTQVSLVAYMSGGAFLGLGYWDLPYHLCAIIMLGNIWLMNNKVATNEITKEIVKPKRICPDTGRTLY